MWKILNRVNGGSRLGVAISQGLEVLSGPICSVHVLEGLCMSQLVLDFLMKKGDPVVGFVVLLENVGRVHLEVLE